MTAHLSSELMLHGSRHLLRLLLEGRPRLEVLRNEMSDEFIGLVNVEYYLPSVDEHYVASRLQDSFMNRVQSWAESRHTLHRLCLPY